MLYPYLGVMYLSAVAKNARHDVEVFVSDTDISDKFISSIKCYNPDIVCFSTTTSNYGFAKLTSQKIKAVLPNCFILLGGWHPTFNPQILEKESCFDALCLGEGEIPFKIFLEYFPDREKIKSVPNFHLKIHNKIYQNPMCDLIQDLDDICFPDRSVYYDKYKILRNQLTKVFIVGRGCPYQCTYCFNNNMKNEYKNKGKYVRFRSPENIIEEINQIRNKYPLKYVQFIDDTFNSNKKWLMSFLDHYEKSVDLPFLACCRVDKLDYEIMEKMKKAGVDRISFAIEHGNEHFREKVLRRFMKNSSILDGSRIIKEFNVRFHVSNMIGLPGETLDLAFETLKINQQIKPNLAESCVFQPYPGTRIFQVAKEQGYLDKDINEENLVEVSSWGANKAKLNSVVKGVDINRILNLHSFFHFLVEHPVFLPVIKPLLSLPPNKYFEFFQNWYYFKIRYKYSGNSRESLNYVLQLTKTVLPITIQRIIEKFVGYKSMV